MSNYSSKKVEEENEVEVLFKKIITVCVIIIDRFLSHYFQNVHQTSSKIKFKIPH